jgi:hypothetical protein
LFNKFVVQSNVRNSQLERRNKIDPGCEFFCGINPNPPYFCALDVHFCAIKTPFSFVCHPAVLILIIARVEARCTVILKLAVHCFCFVKWGVGTLLFQP